MGIRVHVYLVAQVIILFSKNKQFWDFLSCYYFVLLKAEERHKGILGHLLYTVKLIAVQEGLEEGYRVVINDGPNGSKLIIVFVSILMLRIKRPHSENCWSKLDVWNMLFWSTFRSICVPSPPSSFGRKADGMATWLTIIQSMANNTDSMFWKCLISRSLYLLYSQCNWEKWLIHQISLNFWLFLYETLKFQ